MEANQRNAQRSTGPKTEAGKLQSRRNALKHGLAGKGVVLPDEVDAQVQLRMDEWHSAVKPFDVVETFLFEQLCVEAVRIETLNAELDEHRRRQAQQAVESWDEDRLLEAEELARELAKAPTTTPLRLRRTAAGCHLLIGRWEELIAVRCKPSYKRWLLRFAKDERTTPSQLVDQGLMQLAKIKGYELPPER